MADVESDAPESAPLLKESDPEKGSNSGYDQKLKENNAQVGEIMGIMWKNLKGIVERGEKLEDVEQKAGILDEGAERFKVNAKKLKRKHWWENAKYSIVLIIISFIVIGFIVLVLYLEFSVKEEGKMEVMGTK
jgi:hypothetical protein